MTTCPTDSTLRSFLTNQLPDGEAGRLESHIERCADCCARIETLQDVAGLSAILTKAVATAGVQSQSLLVAMDRLQADMASLLDTPSSLGSGGTLTMALPVLPPSEQAGFIGRIGAIDIRRVVARGGMGVVYEGIDPALNRRVAVKVLSPHLLGDDEAKERFVREAQAVAALTADHVVQIHAIDRTDGVPYLVLQYIDGPSLAEVLNERGKLPADELARVGVQIAKGLESAHAIGLVHRDIKPANVLIERATGHVRLTDFGLAKLVGGQTITNVGTLAGTPAFMSPEQASGDEVDARSDLFSLGVLLYTAAVGRLPFSGDSPFVVLDKIRTAAPKRLTDLDPTIPAWFSTLVHQLLEKDPANRVQSAGEVIAAFEQQAYAATVRKRRWPVWAFAAAAVAAAGLFWWGVTQPGANKGAENPPARTESKPNELRIVGRDDRWPTMAGAMAAAADGDVIEVVGDGPHLSGKIVVVGKRLTLKAAAGSNPVIQPEETAPTSSSEWLTTNRDLTLEGLTIDWAGSVRGDADNAADEAAITVTVTDSASLTMRNCRVFVSGTRTGCLSADGTTLLESCHLVCPNSGGWCLVWKPTDTLTVSGTCFEGRNGIALVGHESKVERPIQLTDCTFRCDSAFMRLRKAVPDETPISVATTRCIYDVNNLVTIYFLQGLPKLRPTPQELRNGIKAKLTWQHGGCVYRNKMKYFTLWAPQHAQVPTELDSLSKWQALWKITEPTSIEGDLTFDTRPGGAAGKKAARPVLTAVTNATGPIPAGLLDRP